MLKKLIKKTVNGALSHINYKVVRAVPENIGGIQLFDDLGHIIESDSPVCIDVGANVGQTIDSLLGTFRNPQIYSFEPSKNIFQELQSKGYGHQVSLHNFALGREHLDREFINYENSVLSSFLPLDKSDENRFRHVSESSRETVRVETLDSFFDSKGITSVDILKVDTQGFDLEVLLGARNSLRNGTIRNVLVEINFIKMYEGQSSARDVIDELSGAGFQLIDYYEKVRQKELLAWCTALFGRK